MEVEGAKGKHDRQRKVGREKEREKSISANI